VLQEEEEEEEGDDNVATVAFLRCSVAKEKEEGDDNVAAVTSSLHINKTKRRR